MKKYKRLIPVIAVAAMLAILLASSSVVSYLVDKDSATNTFHIGNVALAVQESGYDQLTSTDRIMVPGTKLAKDPVVQNTGSLPEYVFLAVTVPKRNVSLLNEKGESNEGKKKAGMPANVEIFRTFATDSNATPTAVDSVAANYIDINYNKANSGAGWYHLKTEEITDSNSNKYDVHYFGYNKILAGVDGNNPGEKTIPLFDQIQLKSFIEGEVANNDADAMKVDIKAYGIQSDNVSSVSPNSTTKLITETEVNTVFNIIQNKGLGANYQ